jgi:hypothetical protein
VGHAPKEALEAGRSALVCRARKSSRLRPGYPRHRVFRIDLLEHGWLDGCEATSDPCSHGRLRIVIAGTTVADGKPELGISESALGLLRTLDDDRHGSQEQERLIMHGCGLILMMGCPIGIDWDVEHAAQVVRVRNVVVCDGTGAEDERELNVSADVPASLYCEQVVALAKTVKRFFAASADKVLADPVDRQVYAEFWREFDARLTAAS